jgi:L-rhamnose mutarotase
MQRVAFLLDLKQGAGESYDKDHAAFWPEMLALLKRGAISEYSISRRDTLLVLTMHVEDFEHACSLIENDPVNVRWQKAISAYLVPRKDLRDGERFPMMREVFYLA